MKRKIFCILLALALVLGLSLVLAVTVTANGTTYYVATTGHDDTGDGSAGNPWATIGHALTIAISGDTINVAAGAYIENITLKDGVRLLGAGDDVTTIFGTGIGSAVTALNVGATTKLDGFTVRNGSTIYGGGMHNEDSSPVVSNCTFSSNSAYYGGGMYNDNSSPTVSNCTFCSNSADYGGGMGNDDASPAVTNCTFSSNSATSGGGMYNSYYSEPQVTNCIFSGNLADYGGGMENINWSSAIVVNCTFYNNSADESGSGTHNDYYATPTLANCILWDGGDEIYTANDAVPVFSYCDIQGGYAGTGNINTDPLFVNAGTGDFHLKPDSPCIDAGNNSAPSLPDTDFDGEPRSVDGDSDGVATVDMGVDECPAQVWVDNTWDSQDDVDSFNSALTWQVDAFASINDGINAVTPGGKVNVRAGKYTENITITDKSVTVESVSGNWHNTTIDLPSFVFGLLGTGGSQFNGDVTISGFTLTDSQYGVYLPYGLAAGSSVSLSNCFIHDTETAIYANGVLNGDIFIDDCIVAQNGPNLTGIHLATVAGTVEITDSFIGAYWDADTSTAYEGNEDNGIYIETISDGGEVLIDNNKIVNNTGNGISDGFSGCYGELTITNNVIGAYDYDLTTGNGYFGGNGADGISIDYVGTTGVIIIEGNKIAQNIDDGIEFGSGLAIDGDVTINNNYIGAWTDYTTVGEILYTHSFAGNDDEGIDVTSLTASGQLTIINNKVADNDYVGLHIDSTSGDTFILANHFGSWTQDIPGGTPVSYGGNHGAGIFVMNVQGGSLVIEGNTVADTIGSILTGIHIEEAADSADVRVNLNNILDNDGNGLNYGYGGGDPIENIDAENNWWGDASGPGGEGSGTGDGVSTHVDYDPWLEVSVDGAKAGTITNGTLNNIAGAGTELIVSGGALVTTSGYSGTRGSGCSGDIGKYIDVFIDDAAGVTEIEIRLYYTYDDVAGLDEASLTLHWWNGTSWEVCSESGVNTTDIPGPPAYSGYIWAKIRVDTTPSLAQLIGSVFGGWGPSAYVPPPKDSTAPRISNVSICYEGVNETTADICWTTDERGTSQVKYWASPSLLSPLDRTLVTEHHVHLIDLTPDTTYYYKVMSMDTAGNLAVSDVYSFTTLEEVILLAVFTSSDLSISPGEVAIGETVTISVLVTNSGNAAGSHELTLELNGVVEETKEITLEAGASQSASFTVNREEAGSYSVLIDGLGGSFSVTAPEDTALEGEVAEADAENPVNWPVLGGVIVAVVIVFTIIIAVRRRAY